MLSRLAYSLLLLPLATCSRASHSDYAPSAGPPPAQPARVEYSFGVIPLHNAVHLYQIYEPLVDAVNDQLSGFSIKLATAIDHPHYERKVKERKLNFVMLNSHLVIPAEGRGYRIVGRTSDNIRGIILVRADSHIRRIRDLRGASIFFDSRTDLAGDMMPKLLLKQNGLNVDRQAAPKYVRSPESVIWNVYYGRTAAGCVPESAWLAFQAEQPNVAQALKVRWRTDPLIGLGILARDDIPREHVRKVMNALFDLDETERGRKILAAIGITSFEPANEATYDRVWEFMNDYRRMFGRTPALGDAE
jgi:phosphonate transport system substrate-binding protein